MFDITCNDLALGPYDMVLGVQQMESPGANLWDFRHRTMAFMHHNRRVLWMGTSSLTLPAILVLVSPDLMDDVFLAIQPLFVTPLRLPL